MVRIKTLLDRLGSAVALLSLAPVLPFLDRPILGLAIIAVAVGLWCDHRERFPLPVWLATLLALTAIALYGAQITRVDVATPVVHALVMLLAIRLVSEKQGRDYLQIFVLALFILAGSSLLSLEVGFIVYLVLQIFCVTIGLVLLTVFTTDPRLVMPHRDLFKLLRVSLLLPVVSLLLMGVFFFILPRTSHPLWNFLNPKPSATVGLSETVQPGAFAQISTIKNLAFRAETVELPPEELYWRALVLNRPDGQRWVRSDPPPQGTTRLEGSSPIAIEIYPEPRSDRYLVTLDRPINLTGLRHVQANDQTFKSSRKRGRRLSYEVNASPGADLRVIGQVDRSFYLQTPKKISERVRQTAEQISAGASDTAGRLALLADFFRQQNLSYAEKDLPSGPDVVGQFLFDQKRGYCEFFASAYVTLARLAGIPARLVGGYLGGEYNPLGGYYLVTEDTAHIWVEILDGKNRWQRIDPSQWAINASETLGSRQQSRLNALQQLTDSLNYHWVQAVVVFDLARQIEVFRKASSQLRKLRKPQLPAADLWWVVLPIVALVLFWLGIKWRRSSFEERILKRFQARVAGRFGKGVIRTSCGLTELAEQLKSLPCREFARIYQQAVFRDRALRPDERKALKVLIREI